MRSRAADEFVAGGHVRALVAAGLRVRALAARGQHAQFRYAAWISGAGLRARGAAVALLASLGDAVAAHDLGPGLGGDVGQTGRNAVRVRLKPRTQKLFRTLK